MTATRRALRLAHSLRLAAITLFAIAFSTGCSLPNQADLPAANTSHTFTFSIVHEAGPGTQLTEDNGTLRVSGNRQGDKQVTIQAEGAQRVDVHFLPVTLREGGSFEAAFITDQHDQPFARLRHRTMQGRGQIEADVPGASGAIIEFLRHGQLLHRSVATPFEGSSMFNVASSDDGPSSVHYIEENGTKRVVFDYEEEPDGMTQAAPSDATAMVTPSHVVITPQFDHPGTAPSRPIKGIKLVEKAGTGDLVITKGRVIDNQ